MGLDDGNLWFNVVTDSSPQGGQEWQLSQFSGVQRHCRKKTHDVKRKAAPRRVHMCKVKAGLAFWFGGLGCCIPDEFHSPQKYVGGFWAPSAFVLFSGMCPRQTSAISKYIAASVNGELVPLLLAEELSDSHVLLRPTSRDLIHPAPTYPSFQ